ncbi:MAG TPA: UDP-N-acetylmuramoyl-L-alanyl-D-glutamate--2,6-diaminopimelate ligase [Candidatus Binatia bacterium]|nr:UDP-N-acetylmuramoyl-L-alanyl-D-glutamate--2,6-diaminopimelate ligase [Candidatus Binatia bacterium]
MTIDQVDRTEGDLEQEVSGLCYDSRKVAAGEIFFAAPGEKADGHDFIADAIQRGAAAVVVSRDGNWPRAPASVRVKNVRRSLGLWAAHFYGRPSERIRLIGVTGTNGKTTLTYLIESILQAAALPAGVIGTINYRYAGRTVPSHQTTPESLDLQTMLSEMVRSGVQAVAIEVSSHALAQERVRGLDFDIGVFTNLSRDHLDYHRDMDDYFLAKSKLFTDYLQSSRKPRKSAVICGDDPRGRQLLETIRAADFDTWSYGAGAEHDVHPVKVDADVHGLRGTILARGREIPIDSALIGAANLQNILGAVGVGLALGIDAGVVARGIGRLKAVPGRLERVENNRNISIFVDYAHSPDALEKVLGAVRPLARGKVICVFGCGGDRDRGKRPLMGEIAARRSDLVVLTSDNPRTEEPMAILAEVETGVKKTPLAKLRAPIASSNETERGYLVEADRRKAIAMAIGAAAAGDLVLIAGKGHEDYQILGTSKVHFDDREVARQEADLRASA